MYQKLKCSSLWRHVNEFNNQLLIKSFFFFSNSADDLCWIKKQTLHLSYAKAFNLYNGLWNLIGSLFLVRERTHRRGKATHWDA